MQSTTQFLSKTHDVLLLDLDGVCYRGSEPVPFAADGLSEAKSYGARAVFITNNSSRSPKVVADQLNMLGIETDPADIFNSARTAVMQVLQHVSAGSKVLAIGGEGIFDALASAPLEIVKTAADKPDVVLQGLSQTVGWAELSEAAIAIKSGALHVATNLDATLPTEYGEMIGNGSLVAAVVNATGVQPLSSGKPAPDMYELAVSVSGAKKPLAVGDRLNTDIIGANRAGFDSMHVLTGVSQARDVMLAQREERPTFLALDLSDLNRPVSCVNLENGYSECDGVKAKIEDEHIVIDGKNTIEKLTLAQYRAVTALVWNLIDQGVARERLAWLPDFQVVRG